MKGSSMATSNIDSEKIWLKLYPARYPKNIEIPSVSALDVFEATVNRCPDAPAMHYFDGTLTYRQINSAADALAAGLEALGISRGERIVIQLQNMPQYLMSLYAVWKAGCIAVPINPMYKNREIEFYCKDSGAKIIITMESCYPQIEGLIGKTNLKAAFTTSELDFLAADRSVPIMLAGSKKVHFPETIDFKNYLQKYEGKKARNDRPLPDDIGYLTYTSGTTGPPKGAMNTHRNIVFSSLVGKYAAGLGDTDKIMAIAPFFHVTGGILHVALAAMLGIPVIAMFRFQADEVLRLIEKWKASFMVAPLTAYIALRGHPDFKKRNMSSLTKAASGGAAVPQSVVKKFQDETGIYIHNWYGLTESTSPCIVTPLGLESPADPESGALSIGLPVPNSDVKICDVETGAVLPHYQVGEIVAKGPMVVPGYWNKPEETANAIKDGWLHTGDVGKMDEKGWIYIIDRKKDLINASGYKIWPRDVEDVLYEHEAVAEACVIGVPDSYRGETVKAFVTVRDKYKGKISGEDIKSFCKGKMADYKYPRIVEIVDEIPKTQTGKILRRQLKEQEWNKNKQV